MGMSWSDYFLEPFPDPELLGGLLPRPFPDLFPVVLGPLLDLGLDFAIIINFKIIVLKIIGSLVPGSLIGVI